jgi:hypothetical protein
MCPNFIYRLLDPRLVGLAQQHGDLNGALPWSAHHGVRSLLMDNSGISTIVVRELESGASLLTVHRISGGVRFGSRKRRTSRLKRLTIIGAILAAVGLGFGALLWMRTFDAYAHMDPEQLSQAVSDLRGRCEADSRWATALPPGDERTAAEGTARNTCAEAAKASDTFRHSR